MLNDQAIAAAYLLHHTAVKKVLIVDLDVHQGNGTAEIFRNTPEVFTFSMHAQANYPFEKEQSDKDIALPNGTDDKTYLDILRSILPQLIETQQPDFVFYQAGVDVLATDKLGKLSLTVEGCGERVSPCFLKRVIGITCPYNAQWEEGIPHNSPLFYEHTPKPLP